MYIDLMADTYNLRHSLTTNKLSIQHDFPKLHSLEVMGVMDIPSLVIGRISKSVGIWKLLRKLQDDNWKGGRLGGIEVVSGLPRSLLDIFASIHESDAVYTEGRLWTWPGEIGEYLQCHLWDCWRFSGILEIRRRSRLEQLPASDEGSRGVPGTELILCRLMSSMDALHRAVELPQNEHLLVYNGLMYPAIMAGLEVPLLKSHPDWKTTMDQVRSYFLKRDTFNLATVTFELLGEAWEIGTSVYDIEAAARQRGVEIAVF